MAEKKHTRKATPPQEAPAEAPQHDSVEIETIPIQEYAARLKEIDDLKDKAQENLDGWQRERADFVNYKKRIERDQEMMRDQITGAVIKKYLPVVDDLERALKARPSEGEAAAWAAGIELILRKLQNVLEAEGVQRIPAESGVLFDPMRHEAITHEVSADHESGQIIEVVQQGYTIGDRILRPALVRVAQ